MLTVRFKHPRYLNGFLIHSITWHVGEPLPSSVAQVPASQIDTIHIDGDELTVIRDSGLMVTGGRTLSYSTGITRDIQTIIFHWVQHLSRAQGINVSIQNKIAVPQYIECKRCKKHCTSHVIHGYCMVCLRLIIRYYENHVVGVK